MGREGHVETGGRKITHEPNTICNRAFIIYYSIILTMLFNYGSCLRHCTIRNVIKGGDNVVLSTLQITYRINNEECMFVHMFVRQHACRQCLFELQWQLSSSTGCEVFWKTVYSLWLLSHHLQSRFKMFT